MGIALLLFAQAAITTGDVTKTFDLGALPKSDTCAKKTEGDIIVCGKRDAEKFRLKPIPNADRFEKSPTTASVDLGNGVKADVEAEGANVGGIQSNRMMVRLKIKF